MYRVRRPNPFLYFAYIQTSGSSAQGYPVWTVFTGHTKSGQGNGSSSLQES